MRKYLRIMTAIIATGFLTYFGYGIYSKSKEKKFISERIENVPDFFFKTLENAVFTKKEIKVNTPTVFLYIDSSCEFCQKEAIEIKNSIVEFQNTQLIFVSNESQNKIKLFAEKYKLLNYDNIHFLFDSKGTFTDMFGVNIIPSSIVYSKQQRLVVKYNGFVKAENLLKALR